MNRLILRALPLVLVAATIAIAVPTPASATPGNTYKFQSQSTGLCLDTNASGDVYAHTCNDGLFQRWTEFSGPNPVYKNVATGLCLDATAGSLPIATTCNSGNYQQWQTTLTPVGYRLRVLIVNKCLTTLSTGSPAEVYNQTCNGGTTQGWSKNLSIDPR